MGSRALRSWAVLLALMAPLFATGTMQHAGEACKPAEGAASFGIFYGGDIEPTRLRPLELLRADGGAARPLANPVLTPAQLGVEAVADPVLFPAEGAPRRMYMFFAARPCGGGRWGIAAAQSEDGGLSWRPQGFVLQEPHFDLRNPTVFGHNEHWYLLPEVAEARGEVRLYRAAPADFPAGWRFSRVLLQEGLRAPNIVRHNHKWWLVGHVPGEGLEGQDHVLRLFKSKSPLGPWETHLGGTIQAESATTMGALFKWRNGLHRLGRTCRAGVCGPVEVMQMFISEESFEQDTLRLDFGRPLWRQRAAWDSAGWRHLAITQRGDGAYLAVMEASRLPPLEPQLPGQLRAAISAFKALAALCIAVLLLTGATRVPALRGLLLALPCGRPLLLLALCPSGRRGRGAGKKADDTPPASPAAAAGAEAVVKLCCVVYDHGVAGDSPKQAAGLTAHSKAGMLGVRPRSGTSLFGNGRRHDVGGSGGSSPGGSGAARACSMAEPVAAAWRQLRRRLPPWHVALAATGLALALCGVWASHAALDVSRPFLVQPEAVPVQGQYSKFTLMVMSYDARLRELQWYVRHYSRCPSVGEILVVWNRGTPPNPRTALDSQVPVRVRVEPRNSMNNRFRPDAGIKFRGVLSLDDDILVPCTTVEAAFATWRASPGQLVGFYPRLLLPAGGKGAPGPPVYAWEERVFRQREYNAILAGAAFMDSAALFPAYFSNATAPARALVDELLNCDDLLLNFVAANATRAAAQAAQAAQQPKQGGGGGSGGGEGDEGGCGPPAVRLVRPERRLDLSRLSGVGISHNAARFKAAADRCLAEFSSLFGGSPLQARPLEPGYGPGPSCALRPLIDCQYMSDS